MAAGRLDPRGVIITCPSCGQNNRLPYAALTKSIRCATCKTTLGAPGHPIEAPDSTSFHAAASAARFFVQGGTDRPIRHHERGNSSENQPGQHRNHDGDAEDASVDADEGDPGQL